MHMHMHARTRQWRIKILGNLGRNIRARKFYDFDTSFPAQPKLKPKKGPQTQLRFLILYDNPPLTLTYATPNSV